MATVSAFSSAAGEEPGVRAAVGPPDGAALDRVVAEGAEGEHAARSSIPAMSAQTTFTEPPVIPERRGQISRSE
jgi:hypothetical protein